MIFLRHPTPDVPDGTCYGQTDLNIAEIGHDQIARAMELTPPTKAVLASPALRCRKLAETLAERDSVSLTFDERLWEMNMGDFEGKLWSELDRDLTKVWLADPHNNKTPGGESFADVQKRVLEALSTVGTDTTIVCHAGVIRATQMAWEEKSFKQVFGSQPAYAEPIRIWPPHLKDNREQQHDEPK